MCTHGMLSINGSRQPTVLAPVPNTQAGLQALLISIASNTTTIPSMAQPGPLTTAARVYRKPALHDVEDVEAYVPGGYFPVDIGNKFETNPGTYTVLHKLGFGPSSTVWLVKRECKGSDEVSFHALKILRADCGGPGKAPEMEAMERLEHYGRVDKAHPHVLHIQSWFAAKSANGTHHCFVLPVLGPSLQNCRVFRALDGKRQLEICNQIANAVNYVHAFDVCHGGKSGHNHHPYRHTGLIL